MLRPVCLIVFLLGFWFPLDPAAQRAAPALQQPQPASEFLLAPGRAGKIEQGMPVDKLYEAVGREHTKLVDAYPEGMFSPELDIHLREGNKTPSLSAEVSQFPCGWWNVNRIQVRDERFRTVDGLGVGSTLGDVRKRYEVRTGAAEGAYALVEALQMTFGLEPRWYPVANQQKVPDSATIVSVLLRQPSAEIQKRYCPDRPIR